MQPAAALPDNLLELHGVHHNPNAAGLFKLRGHMAGTEVTLLIDSGASRDFVDTRLVDKCGMTLQPSNRRIRLADGSVVAAQGEVAIDCDLRAAKGAPFSFTSTFVATTLEGYDAILGMTWLSQHDPHINWFTRAVTLRVAGKPPCLINPIPVKADKAPRLATMTMNATRKAIQKGAVDELFLVMMPGSCQQATDSLAGLDTAGTSPTVQNGAWPELDSLLQEFSDVWPEKVPNELPPLRGVEHEIELKAGHKVPPVRPLYHQSTKEAEVVKQFVKDNLESGLIRESHSPFGAMALVVKKKDGSYRVVIDYRGLNEITVRNQHPLPLMNEMFDRVHGATVFSSMDLKNGFHQIRLREGDEHKTAFRTQDGSFEFLVLPMGLCNAPGTFMQLMNGTFRDLLGKSVLCFLDDILVFSKTRPEHIAHLREVLTRLRSKKLWVKLSKCQFGKEQVSFLGHVIGQGGLATQPEKVTDINRWPTPRNAGDVRSFLGLSGFYRRFVPNYSRIALPMTMLTQKQTKFVWDKQQNDAFEGLKAAISKAPVLIIPDPTKPYVVSCDACNFAAGAVLQQDHGKGLQPVAFMSKKFKGPELNYDVREKEFLALRAACLHWRPYLHGTQPFRLQTDHDSLKYHKTMPKMSPRLTRWIEQMAEFDYTIEHIKGVDNVVADALSRQWNLEDGPEKTSDVTVTAQPRDETTAPPRDRVTAPPRDEQLSAVRAVPSEQEVKAQRVLNKAAAEQTVPVPPNAVRPAPNRKGAIVMPTQRCTGTTRLGKHCAQRTAKGQYCWNHLRMVHGLRVKPSTRPDAGLGLFAERNLPSGYSIDYTGDRMVLDSDRDGGVYFLQLTENTAVDAARTNAGEGRWVNDPKGGPSSANSAFCVHTPPGGSRRACIKLTRAVAKGEEILVAYGAGYWRYMARGGQRKARGGARMRSRAPRKVAEQLAAVDDDGAAADAALAAAFRKSALEDSGYAAQVAAPPAGHTVHNGVLLHENRLVVPNDRLLRTRILAECHDAVTACHFGRDKTLDMAKRRFEWPGMTTDVEAYVAGCDTCQRNKPSQQLTPGALMPLPIPERPCMEWTTDSVSVSRAKTGYDCIQVFVERLTKLKHFVPMRSTDTASDLAAVVVRVIIRAHGVPLSIVSDRDPKITSLFYKELARLLGISRSMSTARHPQTDGQSENQIRALIPALSSFCNDRQDDWDEDIDMLELGFNSATQASTKQSPFALMYGFEPRLPIDAALVDFQPSVPASIERAQRIQRAIQAAKENLQVAQQRQIKNASRRPASLKVGDTVLLSTEGLTLRSHSNKLCSRYIGPFAVTKEMNPNSYELELPPQLRALHPVFNIDKLKLYRDGSVQFPDRPVRYTRPPAAERDSNGDEEYTVERIIAERGSARRKQYLVLWQGYPPEEAQWLQRSQLARCTQVVNAWNALQGGGDEDD